MNRSYRSVWNEALGVWVANSKISQGKGKTKSSRVLLRPIVTALMLGGITSSALSMVSMGGGASVGGDGSICSVSEEVGTSTSIWTCQVANGSGGFATVYGISPRPADPTSPQPDDYWFPDPVQLKEWIANNIGPGSIAQGNLDTKATGTNSIAIGNGAVATGDGAIVMGEARADGQDSVAIGKGASASNANSVALGAGSQTHAAVAIASDANLIAGTTLKFAGTSNVLGVVSVGDSAVETRQIVNVAPGELSATSTDAVNGSQLFAVAKGLNDRIDNVSINLAPGGGVSWINANVSTVAAPTATGADALAAGNAANASGAQSTALGNSATARGDNSVAVGYSASATGNAATALGQGAVAAGTGSVAIGSNSNDGGRANVVSVGAEGAERQISNVAPGTQGTDAVNVNQLNQFGSSLQHQIDVNRREANAGTAGAMAMAGMPQTYMPGKSMVAAGVATYRGETALAVGMSRISDSGRWVTKFTGSANSRGNVGVAAGVGYQW